MFWYKVAIYNEGPDAVQIVARMWEIERYASQEKDIVRGTGILQNQPIISQETFSLRVQVPNKSLSPYGQRISSHEWSVYRMQRHMGQHNFPVKVDKVAFVLPMPKSSSA